MWSDNHHINIIFTIITRPIIPGKLIRSCNSWTLAWCLLCISLSYYHNISVTDENDVRAVCYGIIAGLLNKSVYCYCFLTFRCILELPIPFKLSNPNGCVDSNLKCPLAKGKTYKYIASFPVLKTYQKMDVDVKYELRNGPGAVMACVVIPVRIHWWHRTLNVLWTENWVFKTNCELWINRTNLSLYTKRPKRCFLILIDKFKF